MTGRTVPTFLVVGAARSGTTGLVEGLRTNTQVFITEPKEPHYFAFHGGAVDFQGPGDAATINRVSVPDIDDYLSLYPKGGYAVYGDGSVSTMYYHEHALPEVLRMNPQMRLIVLLREPVSRAHSSFQYMRARGFEPLEDFLEAVRAEPERKRDNYHHLWHYTSMSLYADAVAAMADAVGPEQLSVLFYDDLERDYEGTVSQALRFIGAPEQEGEASGVPRVNISGTPRAQTLQRVIWSITRHEMVRGTVKRVTSYRMRESVRRLFLRRTEVPRGAVKELAPRFGEDLARLNEVLDRVGVNERPGWLTEKSAGGGRG
jgi:hypothetical protein